MESMKLNVKFGTNTTELKVILECSFFRWMGWALQDSAKYRTKTDLKPCIGIHFELN
jgi:hypothetical protein